MKRAVLLTCVLALFVVTAVQAEPPIAIIDPIPNQVFEGVGTYTYQAPYTIQNPDCHAGHSFSLVSGPSGMSITSGGYITWTGPGWGGNWDVTIKLVGYSDCLGIGNSVDYESFTLYCQNNC